MAYKYTVHVVTQSDPKQYLRRIFQKGGYYVSLGLLCVILFGVCPLLVGNFLTHALDPFKSLVSFNSLSRGVSMHL